MCWQLSSSAYGNTKAPRNAELANGRLALLSAERATRVKARAVGTEEDHALAADSFGSRIRVQLVLQIEGLGTWTTELT